MRLCKLVTCRLGLFQLMELQSVVIGFVGSQILLFGVNLIICHQFLLVLFIIYNRVLYACCSPFESWHRFPCQNTMVLVSVHSYISPFYFPMGLSTIDSICFSSKSSVLHRIRFRSRSTYHKKSFVDCEGFTKLISCQMRTRDDSVCTPADLWVVKYKYQFSIYFLSAIQ